MSIIITSEYGVDKLAAIQKIAAAMVFFHSNDVFNNIVKMPLFCDTKSQNFSSEIEKNKINGLNYQDIIINPAFHSLLSKIKKKSFPDVMIIDEDKEISLDFALTIVEFMLKSALAGEKKFLIVNNSHNLNKNASNALLKTIEEADNVYIFFICNNVQKIMNTIRSRSVHFNIHSDEKIQELSQKNKKKDKEEGGNKLPKMFQQILSLMNCENHDVKSNNAEIKLEALKTWLEASEDDIDHLERIVINQVLQDYHKNYDKIDDCKTVLVKKYQNHLIETAYEILQLFINYRKFNLDKKTMLVRFFELI